MKPLSILVVEDDHDSREVMVAIIARKFPQASVYSAANGRIGLDLFITHTPEIVITDINMPEMNGYQMAHRIASLKPETKFIALTADTERTTMDNSDQEPIGFEYYILKPVKFAEVFAAVNRMIEGVSSTPTC